MKKINKLLVILGISLTASCDAAQKVMPTQTIYRFDANRSLELVGYNCEGALWFRDTQRNIFTEVTSQFYRLFTKTYIHPSERYIAITYNDVSGFLISKDYGRTWDRGLFSPGAGASRYGSSSPNKNEVNSFTVINDQGFVLTKEGDIYMSSKPFDAVDPESGQGGKWGKEYASWNSFAGPKAWTIDSDRKNFQDIPNKVPEVKNYTGWDHMRCDMDAGKAG